ncbi:pentapeptide repeat-containing protein [Catellatospora paridis]|uniref:pentapeptide repeat-containing protein n=1 Tax=Catellatospora paridis TaxID=1617086 RepID=UPI0012D3FCD2|nr:pentapeptide repeat-containing protein [Catellatospora paridis]
MAEVTEDASFSGEDWYGDELEDRHFLRCTFRDVDMTELSSRNAVFEECVFGNVKFNASRHADSAFLRCSFLRCNLFEAEFTGCKLTGSVFEQCTLRPLRVIGGDWSFVNLSDADLRGVTFSGVRMREADLTSALCDGATISAVDLSGAHLTRAKLNRCDLRGSDLTALHPNEVELRDAVIDPAQAVVIAQSLGLRIG